MIKSIQLRGISNTPSDRMTADGGCCDSVNLYVDQDELAPMMPPLDASIITSDNPVWYIHKTPSYTNYVTFDGTDTFGFYVKEDGGYESVGEGITISGAAESKITSVGNTILVMTADHIHYIKYKEGVYEYLGTKIPEPVVTYEWTAYSGTNATLSASNPVNTHLISRKNISGLSSSELHALEMTTNNDDGEGVTTTPASIWNSALNNPSVVYKYKNTTEEIQGRDIVGIVKRLVWEQAAVMVDNNRSKQYFSRPVFARTAVKLADGQYIYHSVPYLLGAGQNAWMKVHRLGTDEYDYSGSKMTDIEISFMSVFKAKVKVSYPDLSDWKDIVQGVDVFLSTDICNPEMESDIKKLVYTSGSENNDFHFLFGEQSAISSFADVKEEVLSKSLFYKVESIETIKLLSAEQQLDIKPLSQDDLVTRSRLANDTLSHHESWSMNDITAYNERVIYSGLKQKIYAGYPEVQSHLVGSGAAYKVKYYLHTNVGDQASNMVSFTSACKQGPFIFYPDPRCYQVDIKVGDYAYRIPMTEHPGLNGSYALCSLSDSITTIGSGVTLDTATQPYIDDATKFVMSDSANPFRLPTTSRLDFSAKVMKVATVTTALSTNRTGRLPLYVFTEDGVWAVEINDDGSVGSQPQAVCRDVALSPKSITSIDNAVVFVTRRGVLMLQGSQATDISPAMTGPHVKIGDSVKDLLTGTRWAGLKNLIDDSEIPFMEFMISADAIYDYNGSRLLFWSDGTDYMYVLMLATGTWHRMYMTKGKTAGVTGTLVDESYAVVRVLNSYPEAFVSADCDDTYKIYDFSTRLESMDYDDDLFVGMQITRALDLDNPYVQKSITHLYPRGYYDEVTSGGLRSVEYILTGSMDGKTFHVVTSLRGKSWKFYRIILLTQLRRADRISYIDIDYDTKFTNRIR